MNTTTPPDADGLYTAVDGTRHVSWIEMRAHEAQLDKGLCSTFEVFSQHLPIAGLSAAASQGELTRSRNAVMRFVGWLYSVGGSIDVPRSVLAQGAEALERREREEQELLDETEQIQ